MPRVRQTSKRSLGMRTLSHLITATVHKVVREMFPPDARLSNEVKDLLADCCTGESLQNPIVIMSPRPLQGFPFC